MSRRDAIRMSDAEAVAFLAEERTLTCATLGPGGRPHLVPLWYVVEGTPEEPVLAAWTYARSQKARNLERVPQATLQVEAGEVYAELRGWTAECDVELVRDPDAVAALGRAVLTRYGTPSADVDAVVAAQAPKRLGMRFRPTRTASWDHRRLGGVY